MGTVDLDAARAARAEARKERHSFTFGGEKFKLPDELPLDIGVLIMQDDIVGAVKAMLASESEWERFYALHPTIDDIKDLFAGVAPLYGFASPGESQASAGSSSTNGTRPRRTSSGTTKSTSAKRAGAKPKGSASAV